jgi:hypothetical protein
LPFSKGELGNFSFSNGGIGSVAFAILPDSTTVNVFLNNPGLQGV